MKRFFLLLFLVSAWLPFSSADELVLTTYYPAPNGQYFNMNVSNLLTAEDVIVNDTLTVGTLIVTGDLSVGRDLSVTRNLSVTGTSQLMGNVGVGAAPSAYKLQVNGTADVTGATTLRSTLDVTGATLLNSTLRVNGTSQLMGNVGIGAAPSALYKLQVTGTADVTGATTLRSTLDVTGATNLLSTLHVVGNATLDANLTVAGQAAFGTNAISAGHVVNINASDPSMAALRWSGAAAGGAIGFLGLGTAGDNVLIGASAGTSSNLIFRTNNSPQMIITTTGRFGMGVLNPAERLDVTGNIKVTGNINASGTVTAAGKMYAQTPTAADPNNTVATKEYVDNNAGAVSTVSANCSAFRFVGCSATCPAGRSVVGGGGTCTQPSGAIWLKESRPSGASAWFVNCDGGLEHETASATVYALCM